MNRTGILLVVCVSELSAAAAAPRIAILASEDCGGRRQALPCEVSLLAEVHRDVGGAQGHRPDQHDHQQRGNKDEA